MKLAALSLYLVLAATAAAATPATPQQAVEALARFNGAVEAGDRVGAAAALADLAAGASWMLAAVDDETVWRAYSTAPAGDLWAERFRIADALVAARWTPRVVDRRLHEMRVDAALARVGQSRFEAAGEALAAVEDAHALVRAVADRRLDGIFAGPRPDPRLRPGAGQGTARSGLSPEEARLLGEGRDDDLADRWKAILADPAARSDLLYRLQTFSMAGADPAEVALEAIKRNLLARPDMAAAVDAVGRIETYDFPIAPR